MSSPYIRDIVADMPTFRDRGRPLPMRPIARCSKATAKSVPPTAKALEPDRSMSIFAGYVPIGSIEVYYDENIPSGLIEIDGTVVAIEEVISRAKTAWSATQSL